MKSNMLIGAFTLLPVLACAQAFKEIPIDRSVKSTLGQPACASMANNHGVTYYENSIGALERNIPKQRVLDSMNLEPKGYQKWDQALPEIYRAYVDKVFDKKYRSKQEAVEDIYKMCMESTVASERDRLFK